MAGLVYPEFPNCIVDPQRLSEAWRSLGGVDFGFQHPSAVVFGLLDKQDVLWIVDEIYGARMTDEELADRIRCLAQSSGTTHFWCDSSAAQSIARLQRAGLPAYKAVKDVAPGIRAVTDRVSLVASSLDQEGTRQDDNHRRRLLCEGFPDKSPRLRDYPDKRPSLFPHVKSDF
jgi:hypothetical protein